MRCQQDMRQSAAYRRPRRSCIIVLVECIDAVYDTRLSRPGDMVFQHCMII